MEDQEKFYTIQEFSDLLRIHPNTIYKSVKNGRIQAMRIGEGRRSSYRISSNELSRLREFDMMKIIEKIVDEKMEKLNGMA